MRWWQFGYNVFSFICILFLVLNELTNQQLETDDIQHSKAVNKLAFSIDSKVSGIEQSILQAKTNIEELKNYKKLLEKEKSSQYEHQINPKPTNPKLTPLLYVITPTYVRWTQKAELTRIGQSLAASKVPIHWVIIEDTDRGYPAKVLLNFQKRYDNWAETLTVSLLTAATDSKFKLQPDDPNWLFPRGAAQRNKGLDFVSGLGVYNSFIESDSGRIVDFGKHLTTTPVNNSAVVYFADDDNTYDHELFAELTKIPRDYHIGVLPVGIVGGLAWEGPICENGEVTDFHTAWKPERPYPLDMAGFAVQLSEIKVSHARFSYHTRRGYLETDFLLKLVGTPMRNEGFRDSGEYFEYLGNLKKKALKKTVGLADDCSKVLVWHTRTEKPKDKDEKRLEKVGQGSPEMEI